MKEILTEIDNFKVNKEWYLEDPHYFKEVEIRFDNIVNRLKRKLRNANDQSAIEEVEQTMNSTSSIDTKIFALSLFLENYVLFDD